MSDHRYMCDLFDVTPSQEHELVDIVLAEDAHELQAEQESLLLDAGRTVHLIWLTTAIPAKVIRVELNTQLQEPLEFLAFNRLTDKTRKEPGSWFVNKGFMVRSKRVGGHWLQCAFVSSGPVNLTRSEIIEYLRDVAKMDFDDSKIGDHSCVTSVG